MKENKKNYTPWKRFFFSVGIFSASYFLARIFFLWNQSAGYFFLKSPIRSYPPPPSKVKWSVTYQGFVKRSFPTLGQIAWRAKRTSACAREASFSIAWLAGVRKGREGNLGARPRARNPLPVPFQTPATQATGGPEKVLGLTCVQSQSSLEIRKAQPVIIEFSTFLKINKSREHIFTVNTFYPI